MAEKVKEDKIVLEREYIVPLRRKFAHTPQYKRTPKAIRALKIFIAKHMKVDSRDTDKVKLDKYVNEELWFKGIRKPLAKIKVKAKKFESGIVTVELAEIPQFLKWKIDREKRKAEESEKGKPVEKEQKTEEEKKEETTEEKKEKEEKNESVREAGMAAAEQKHRETKHVKTKEKPQVRRMALQK